jgi:alanine racemase
LRLPEYQFDMVRLGIGLYGIDPTTDNTEGLKPVATLKTIISQIKHIPAGETIGYGRKGKASEPMTVATIAIGYADGFSRAFSRGAGRVLIQGKQVPVMGNVCMDMTMIDITGLTAQEGDEVIIFGPELPIQQLASSINTISYEILTSTSERVKRVFVAESI